MKFTSKWYGLVVRLLFLTSTAFVDTKCEGGDLNTLFKRLYEDMVSGRITAERFDMLASEYEQEQKELKVKIVELEDLIENGETQTKDLKQLLVNVRKYTDPQELTAQMVNDLVDKIIVHAPDKSSGHRKQKIEIYYNAVGIIDLPTAQEDDCIALHGRCKGKKIAVWIAKGSVTFSVTPPLT